MLKQMMRASNYVAAAKRMSHIPVVEAQVSMTTPKTKKLLQLALLHTAAEDAAAE
jgi:hypothetical protein